MSDEAQKKFALEVSAMLGAHERLIRDLFVNVIGRLDDPLTVIESYIQDLKSKSAVAIVPGVHPVESDQLNQMISEMMEQTLQGVREDLLEALRREHQQKNKPRSGNS